MRKEMIVTSENVMEELGEKIARLFRDGACIALYGDLGTGKSVFVRGIAKELGVSHVTSPTFTILQSYDSCPPLYHIDAYRLRSSDELLDVGFSDCMQSSSLIAVEWADIVEDALPRVRMNVRIFGSGMEPRRVVLEAAEDLLSEKDFLAL